MITKCSNETKITTELISSIIKEIITRYADIRGEMDDYATIVKFYPKSSQSEREDLNYLSGKSKGYEDIYNLLRPFTFIEFPNSIEDTIERKNDIEYQIKEKYTNDC